MDENTKQKLALLIKAFENELPTKITEIKDEWSRLSSSSWQANEWESFYRKVHSLVGSSGMYGYTDLSDHLRVIQNKLNAFSTVSPEKKDYLAIEKLIQSLNEKLNHK